jgi:hypothetical protein
VGSATFRIEAQGFINGESRARLVTIVQRAIGRTGSLSPLTVFSWRSLPPLPVKEGAAKG